MTTTILAINAGSSSIKFALYDFAGADSAVRIEGQLDGIGTRPRLTATAGDGQRIIDRSYTADDVARVGEAGDVILAWLAGERDGRLPDAVGHRLVLGGAEHAAPVAIDSRVFDSLREMKRSEVGDLP